MSEIMAYPVQTAFRQQDMQPNTKQTKLLFLSCDGPNGTTRDETRKRLRRHVQLDYQQKASAMGTESPMRQISTPSPPAAPVQIKFRGTYRGVRRSVSKTAISHQAPAVRMPAVKTDSTPEDDDTHVELYHQPHGFDPFGSLAASRSTETGSSLQQTHELLTWHLFPLTRIEVETDALGGYLKIFKRKWWDLAMVDEGFYHALTAYVMRTREAITGTFQCQAYLRHRGLAIQCLQQAVSGSDKGSPKQPHGRRCSGISNDICTTATALTIALLSDFAVYDNEDGERATHLAYLQNLVSGSFLEDPSLHGTYWFSLVTSSLKHSLWSIDAPHFEYSLSPSCRFDAMLANRADLQFRARRAAHAVVPKLPTTNKGRDLDSVGMFSLFYRMNLDVDNMATLDQKEYAAAMGMFYNLAHGLSARVAEAQRLLAQPVDEIEDATEAVFCVLLASQLSAWAMCVHKVHSRCRSVVVGTLRVLDRTVETLQRRPDLVDYWSKWASLDSLVWVLFVSAAYTMLRLKEDDGMRGYLCMQLDQVLDELVIENVDELRDVLKAFPWVPGWTEGRIKQVWKMMGRE